MSQMLTHWIMLYCSHCLMIAVQLLIFQIIYNEMRLYFSYVCCCTGMLEISGIILLNDVDCSCVEFRGEVYSLLIIYHLCRKWLVCMEHVFEKNKFRLFLLMFS